METTRRDVLKEISVGGAVAVLAACKSAAAQAPALDAGTAPIGAASPPPPGMHQMAALPFDPKKLNGLSEALITSHYQNNYAGALKNLNAVELDIMKVTKDSPGYLVGGLKERELNFTNSVILHELYFGNLGGDGKAAGTIQTALADTFGGFARWEELFRATGMSVAGGSGWAILDFNLHTGDPRIYWSGGHTNQVAFGFPLLVMDMYEHAYHIDFGAAAAKYVDAFFMNIQWGEVDRRYQRALAAFKAVRA
jgi:Fe-Mn family superoxide dismutase